jgi:hypothetical protein
MGTPNSNENTVKYPPPKWITDFLEVYEYLMYEEQKLKPYMAQ